MDITATNAYEYSDNFSIMTAAEPVQCYGCEHNQTEADAVARYLTSYHGRTFVVRRNSKDDVRAAQALRGKSNVFHVHDREVILSSMRVGQ